MGSSPSGGGGQAAQQALQAVQAAPAVAQAAAAPSLAGTPGRGTLAALIAARPQQKEGIFLNPNAQQPKGTVVRPSQKEGIFPNPGDKWRLPNGRTS